VQTSHKANFQDHPPNYKRVTIDPNVKNRLSVASWDIGTPSTGPIVNTIAKLSFQDRENPWKGANKEESIRNIAVMRSHNYKMGDNQLNYETTANRVEHINRTLEPNRSPERTIEEARLDLGRHHFDFGKEDGARTTTNQRQLDKKV